LPVPEIIDNYVAGRFLESEGIEIDRLSTEQEKYLKSWQV